MERRTEIVDLTPAQLDVVVGEHLPGESLREHWLLQGGRANTNYALETVTNGDGFRLRVLRLHVREPKTCAKEVALAAMLTDVPIPRVLGHGDIAGHPYMLMEHAPGQTLQYFATEERVPPTAARNIGRVLARIAKHMFDISGDLHTGPDGSLCVEPWGFGDDALLGFVKWCLFDSSAGARLGVANRDRLWRITQARPRTCTNERARLVHGDFNPSNILIDAAGEVTGVLDWEFAHAGDPIADVANLLRRRTEYKLPEGFADGLLRGFTDEDLSLPPDWRDQAAFTDLTSALEFLSSAEDKPVTHAAAKAQIERFLADRP